MPLLLVIQQRAIYIVFKPHRCTHHGQFFNNQPYDQSITTAGRTQKDKS